MTKRFIKMCEVYKVFAKSWDCDFSDFAMKEMYEFETFGKGNIEISGFNTIGKKSNGYAVGKKWLNVTLDMWFDSIKKFGWRYTISELNKDKEIPRWYIEEFFSKFHKDKKKEYLDLGLSHGVMEIFEEDFKESTKKEII